MTSMEIIIKPEGFHQMCRLCLSEESLHGLWEQEDLHQWISDYLSIMVSAGDRMSQSICTICQVRITEFHHFRINCQKVQGVLQSMMEDDFIKREEISLTSADQEQNPEISESATGNRQESDHSEDFSDRIERDAKIFKEEMKDEQLELEDQFVAEEIKVESRTDEDLESLLEDSNPVIAEKDGATKEPPLECEICNTSVSSRKRLLYHKRAIHGTKDYHCSACGVKFTFRSYLTNHFKTERHLRKTKQLRYKSDEFRCNKCHRAYDTKTRLDNHKKRSHGLKFSCDICGKAYIFRPNLQRHMQSKHADGLDDRPFECDLCQKAFRERKVLNWHMKVVHGPKAFECSLCDYKCTAIYNLNRHMLKHSSAKG